MKTKKLKMEMMVKDRIEDMTKAKKEKAKRDAEKNE